MPDYRVIEYPTNGFRFERSFATSLAAMRHVKRRRDSTDGHLGEIEILQVMEMDRLVFEWQYGKGITFPDAAELAKLMEDGNA